MLGAREPMMDLVRATTGAFAAAAGGADAITVLPPMIADRAFAARMARNVQLILGEESSLARTADPGAGSGAVEALTAQLAAEAWGLFTRIEAEGGLAAAIRTGSILEAVATARDGRLEAVARRRIPLVGINVNVDPDAPLPVLTAPDLATDGRLHRCVSPSRSSDSRCSSRQRWRTSQRSYSAPARAATPTSRMGLPRSGSRRGSSPKSTTSHPRPASPASSSARMTGTGRRTSPQASAEREPGSCWRRHQSRAPTPHGR
jgi:methylmalonyl-CoA mutase N-terminal domain/subunit